MAEAAFWGFIGASALIVGAEIAFTGRLNRFVIGLVMAFGVGTLISSVSFELIAPSMSAAETWQVGLALFAGAIVFYLGDRAIQNMSAASEDDDGGGLGIVLGTVLDGIPESVVLGMSLSTGDGVSVALLAAIWISNFPESLGATSNLERSGMERGRIRLMWWGIAAIAAVSAALGYIVIEASGTLTGALVQSFAAGALLTMIVDEMAPESFERSSIHAGLATTAGFAFAVYLTTLEL